MRLISLWCLLSCIAPLNTFCIILIECDWTRFRLSTFSVLLSRDPIWHSLMTASNIFGRAIWRLVSLHHRMLHHLPQFSKTVSVDGWYLRREWWRHRAWPALTNPCKINRCNLDTSPLRDVERIAVERKCFLQKCGDVAYLHIICERLGDWVVKALVSQIVFYWSCATTYDNLSTRREVHKFRHQLYRTEQSRLH